MRPSTLLLTVLITGCSPSKDGKTTKRTEAAAPAGRRAPATNAELRAKVLASVKGMDSERKTMLETAAALRAIGPQAVPLLVDLMKRGVEADPRRAAMCLGLMGEMAKSAVPALLGALKSPNRGLRKDATYAIGMTGDRSKVVVDALISALGDATGGVRRASARVLGRMGAGARTAVKALVARLEDKDWSVRKAAALALGMIGDKTAIPALRLLQSQDAEKRVQRAAAQSIQRLEGMTP